MKDAAVEEDPLDKLPLAEEEAYKAAGDEKLVFDEEEGADLHDDENAETETEEGEEGEEGAEGEEYDNEGQEEENY